MTIGSHFGWADDLGPIDTSPVNFPHASDTLIERAARTVPAILENVDPAKNYGEISAIASLLVDSLVARGHMRRAASWAVHRLVEEGKLLAKPVYDEVPTVICQTGSRALRGLKADTRQIHVSGGGFRVRPIPEAKPAPLNVFRVVATEALWAWWDELRVQEGDGTGESQTPATALPCRPPNTSADQAKPAKIFRRSRKPKHETDWSDIEQFFVSALTAHHLSGKIGSDDPLSGKCLASMGGVTKSTVSAFMKKALGGHKAYKLLCRNRSSLEAALKRLNFGYQSRLHYGVVPPGETDRRHEE